MQQRILAVDDEPHMLKLLERIIAEKTPYHIEVTNNSLAVPPLLEEQQFDLIVTDLKMPGMDGMDIVEWVRQHDRNEEIIIITAFGSLESAGEALARGVFDYITKPFKKEQLIAAVDRAMSRQQVRHEQDRLAKIFAGRPYQEARREFDREYVRRLAEECDGDIEAMARRSGLDGEFLNRHLPSGPSADAPASQRQQRAGMP